ncbi:MAG: hypothetical protein R2789_11800 [Microthrixaceae bacterium]
MALRLGPIELAWLLAVALLPAGVLLFTEQIYLAAVPLILLGIATAWWGPFASSGVWRADGSWFVPAGITLADHGSSQSRCSSPAGGDPDRPAHVATDATDLTVGAPGLVLEVDLSGPLDLAPARAGEPTGGGGGGLGAHRPQQARYVAGPRRDAGWLWFATDGRLSDRSASSPVPWRAPGRHRRRGLRREPRSDPRRPRGGLRPAQPELGEREGPNA